MPPSTTGVGTNKLAAGVSFPCSGFTLLVAAGGKASARGPHENPINDDADLEESKAMDKDERRTLFEGFPETGPGLGRVIDSPGETDEDG